LLVWSVDWHHYVDEYTVSDIELPSVLLALLTWRQEQHPAWVENCLDSHSKPKQKMPKSVKHEKFEKQL